MPSSAYPGSGPADHSSLSCFTVTRTPVYRASAVRRDDLHSSLALIDRGCNGGIGNGKPLGLTDRYVHLTGLQAHTVRDLRIGSMGWFCESHLGPTIIVGHEFATMTDARTIMSPVQMESYGWTINDKAPSITGVTPYIESPDGYRFPLEIIDGLPYLRIRTPTDAEFSTLPHVYLTADVPWDPTIVDAAVPPSWYSDQPKNPVTLYPPFDALGNLSSDTHTDGDPSSPTTIPTTRSELLAFAATLDDPTLRRCHVRTRSQRRATGRSVSSPRGEKDCPTDKNRRRSKQKRDDTPIVSTVTSDEEPDDTPELLTVSDHDYSSESSASSDSESDASTDGGPPPLAQRSRLSSSSSESSDDQSDDTSTRKTKVQRKKRRAKVTIPADGSDNGEKLPSYNNRAKKATGIAYPPKYRKMRVTRKKDLKRLKQFFPNCNEETIRHTLGSTTQYGSRGAVEGTTLRQQIKAPNPVLNIPRRNEDVATDTMYSAGGIPAIDDGSTACQFFIGRTSMFRSVYPLGKSDKHFVSAFMDEVRKRGAMNRIISDNAKSEISNQLKNVLRMLMIDDHQSEPHQQRQNFAERGWNDTKSLTDKILNISGAPADCWLLAAQYVCYLMNHTAYKSIGWRTPMEWLLGYTPDISVLLQFRFYEPVYYSNHGATFPGDSSECIGRFVGVSENVGHPMTYKILTAQGKIISRAVVRTATKDGPYRNLRAERAVEDDEEDDPEVAQRSEAFRKSFERDLTDGFTPLPEDTIHVRSRYWDRVNKDPDVEPTEDNLPTLGIEALVGRTFVSKPDMDGNQHWAKITDVEPTGELTADGKDVIVRFKCKYGEHMFEEIMSYNKMLDWVERDKLKDDCHKVEAILGHRKAKLPHTKGNWELHIRWEGGAKTWEGLSWMYDQDPISVAFYAQKNDLLNTPGFRRCRRDAKNLKKFGRLVNQQKLRNRRLRPMYKYGYQVPRDHDEAVFIDEKNGNTKWQDSEKLEIKQIDDYDTHEDLGLGTPIPEGYTNIPCHMVYDVKHDGRHKARFVAGGHKTSTPIDATYSGVVSLQGIRLVTFLAELNDLELWGTDIGNAYLESYTSEKICFIAGKEFGERAGHTMKMVKAQYGLKSSGKCWHDRLFEVLYDMGFRPSKAEADIWMRDAGDHYEYLACYVDDLLIASKNPQAIIDALEGEPNKFVLKGTGPVSFHLGCDFGRDPDGTMWYGPTTYIDRLKDQYQTLFGENPSTRYTAPIEKDSHPELDTSPLLDEDMTAKYQSIIGALQWVVTLGRFDIAVAVMTLSSFRAAPREGHLACLKRVVGYLIKFRSGRIRVRTGEPDFSDLPSVNYDWSHTVYGEVHEELPRDAPKPLGKSVSLATHVDANLYHDWATGRSVTGILHFINQMPLEWFAKKQPTVETATYGSEFVAAKMATQQALGLRTILRYLGVSINGSTKMFGDNGSVVTSGSLPHSPLKKRHLALAYHYTREAIASEAIEFHHIPGHVNPADILSKHWGHSSVWPTLKPILFWMGDTATLLSSD